MFWHDHWWYVASINISIVRSLSVPVYYNARRSNLGKHTGKRSECKCSRLGRKYSDSIMEDDLKLRTIIYLLLVSRCCASSLLYIMLCVCVCNIYNYARLQFYRQWYVIENKDFSVFICNHKMWIGKYVIWIYIWRSTSEDRLFHWKWCSNNTVCKCSYIMILYIIIIQNKERLYVNQ